MKKNKCGIRILCSICVAFCWWGLLYPELTMTPDTYQVVWENGVFVPENKMKWDSEEDVYKMFLETDKEQIRFKSRLLEYLIK